MKQIRTVTNVQYKVRWKISYWVVEVSINQYKAPRKLPLPKGSLKYRCKRPAGKRKYL